MQPLSSYSVWNKRSWLTLSSHHLWSSLTLLQFVLQPNRWSTWSKRSTCTWWLAAASTCAAWPARISTTSLSPSTRLSPKSSKGHLCSSTSYLLYATGRFIESVPLSLLILSSYWSNCVLTICSWTNGRKDVFLFSHDGVILWEVQWFLEEPGMIEHADVTTPSYVWIVAASFCAVQIIPLKLDTRMWTGKICDEIMLPTQQ